MTGVNGMGNNRILIVEDDKSISDGISINLKVSSYDYVIFDNGLNAAQSLAQDHSYDLALIDIMLPGIDGFELLKYINKYNIPVIYLTAKDDAASEIKGLRDGAEDYIVKPFEIVTLLVRIEKILERMGKLNKVLRIKDITIDIEKHNIVKSGEEITLKPMEFEVLVMLARYPNRTIPREKILNELWGIDFFGDIRTVDVHIANIRKKLNSNDLIKTIPKYGYRLEI